MRALIVRCPNCNANLEVAATVTSTTCSYCGTVARIQARTAMFQIPKAPSLPVQSAQMTNMERLQQLKQFQQMPIARQRVSVLAVLIPMFVIMGIAGAGVFFAMRAVRGGISNFTHSLASRTLWAGHAPAMIDVDGDGVADPIGVIRYVADGDRTHFAAFSGKTGEALWESEPLGRYKDVSQSELAVAGNLFVVAGNDGSLTGRDAKAAGAVKWTISFGEKIAQMCSSGAAELVVSTADDKWWTVDAQGGKRESKKLVRLDRSRSTNNARALFDQAGVEAGTVCLPAGKNHRSPTGLYALEHWHDLAKIPGMRIEMIVKRGGGPTIALGSKQPGTSIPMVARIEGARATWTAEIPAVDPLNTRFESKVFTVSDKAAFALYRPSGSSDSARLTAFDLASGKRLWDRAFQHGTGFVPTSLVVTGDVVLLATWSELRAFAMADGADRYSIGGQ